MSWLVGILAGLFGGLIVVGIVIMIVDYRNCPTIDDDGDSL